MKQTKTETIVRVLSVILRVLLYAAAGALLFFIWRLNMLPGRYFLLLAAVVLLFVLPVSLMMALPRKGKWQNKPGYARQIIGCILALILIVGCAAGSYAVGTLNSTISSITSTSTVHVLLEVYVRADDPAQYVQDAAGYTFAVSGATDAADLKDAIADLEELVGSGITTVSYPSAFSTIDALYSGEVDAIILDSSYLSILDTVDGYANFDQQTRMLHEYVIEKESSSSGSDPVDAGILLTPLERGPTNTPFLLYISGNDARRELLADGGSDVNILVVVNPVDKQILMVNTPRDYYVVNPASGNGSRDKLSHCGLKGIDNCIRAMSDLYGQPIHYYARINFSGFRTLINAIGGITVYSDVSFNTGKYIIREGENLLNGDRALALARERKNLPGGDNDRGKNQMKIIEAMIRKLASGMLLKNYGEIMESLEGMFTTSMSAKDIGELVQLQLSEQPDWEIFSFAVTGDGGSNFCWAAGGNGYVMYPHENVVAHASALIEKVLNGEVITQEDLIVE